MKSHSHAPERVQKLLARAGVASSRRKAEELIEQGLVTINGKVAQLGDRADPHSDAIKVGKKRILFDEPPVYIALHKPKGVISLMEDPQGRPTLRDLLEHVKTRHLFPVGRLDFNSEGLLLLTNDGELAQKLLHNESLLRVYRVKIKGHPTSEQLARLEQGLVVQGRRIQPQSVQVAEELSRKSVIEIAFLGSGALDLKAFFEKKGFLVDKMVRTGIGSLSLKGLESGKYRFLKKSQVQALMN